MPQAKGTVQAISSRQVNTRKGPGTTYGFKLNEEWYNCGFRKPTINKGDYITFDYEEDNYGKKVDSNNISVTAPASPEAASAPAPKKSFGGGRDDYWAKKEEYDHQVREPMIHYQSATKDAVAICVAALNAGILPTGAGKKDDKFETFRGLIAKVRDDLFADLHKARDILKEGGSLIAEAEAVEDVSAVDEGFADDDDWNDEVPF